MSVEFPGERGLSDEQFVYNLSSVDYSWLCGSVKWLHWFYNTPEPFWAEGYHLPSHHDCKLHEVANILADDRWSYLVE